MKLIKEEVFNLTLKDHLGYIFDVAESGFYLIEITASAKSNWQNTRGLVSFFDDDDLAVQIDGKTFPHLNGKGGLFDGEAAWNGNNLRGAIKTCAVVAYLEKGPHLLEFLPDVGPVLHSIKVWQAEGGTINYLPKNNPPQDGDRRQWIAIILADVGLQSLSITAKAGKRKHSDDENIKLIIDGKIEKNQTPKAHKDWFWCGKVLEGRELEFTKQINLDAGLHYIELWSDKTPQLQNIVLQLGKASATEDNNPVKVKEGFNPLYVLKDSAFVRNVSMNESQIQAFLDEQHKDKTKSHLAVMKFEGKSTAFWVKKAADDYSINPKLILTKLQAEKNLIRGEKSINPTQNKLDWAMGVGALDDGTKLIQFKGFQIQITNAAKLFREYFDEAAAKNLIHSNIDGKVVKALNAATYSLYRYTPHFDGPKLVYSVYAGLFGYDDLGGVTADQKHSRSFPRLLIMSVLLLLMTGVLNLIVLSTVHSQSNEQEPLYIYHEATNLGGGWQWEVKLDILSGRTATMEDGLYCGFRFGNTYQYKAKLDLVFQGKIMDSTDLSNPEVVFDFFNADIFYYQPQDIDGDGKKAEFVIAQYATCNGNLLEFVRPNLASGRIEKIPKTDEGKESFLFYVDISPGALQMDRGDLRVEYYNNADSDDMPVGFYRDFYKYDTSKRKFVWQSTQKQ